MRRILVGVCVAIWLSALPAGAVTSDNQCNATDIDADTVVGSVGPADLFTAHSWPVSVRSEGDLTDLTKLEGVVLRNPRGETFILTEGTLALLEDGRIYLQKAAGFTNDGKSFSVDNSKLGGTVVRSASDLIGTTLQTQDGKRYKFSKVALATTAGGLLTYKTIELQDAIGNQVPQPVPPGSMVLPGCALAVTIGCQCPALFGGSCGTVLPPPLCGDICGILGTNNCVGVIVAGPACVDLGGCAAIGRVCCTTTSPGGAIVGCPCL